ncbi:MAG TPA: phosphoribosylglycinamide formyltransferase [Candidatus Saccharimonadia bacterium]|nr:phosphoribosylglycinamide formyltransferase [Candidatus Saccharimonadia bacterium]
MNAPKQLAVLASGNGSNLEAILADALPVALVITDRACNAAVIAGANHIPLTCIDREAFGYRPGGEWNREAFTDAVTRELTSYHIDLAAMAGFMTVLSPGIFKVYSHRVLNTHPSLLPAFPGDHAVRDALAAGVAVTGCTVHIATAELDRGPIIASAQVSVRAGDTQATLHERIKTAERQLYPQTIRKYLDQITAGE